MPTSHAQTNVPAPAPGAAGAEPATKKKRSLEDLMGGEGWQGWAAAHGQAGSRRALPWVLKGPDG